MCRYIEKKGVMENDAKNRGGTRGRGLAGNSGVRVASRRLRAEGQAEGVRGSVLCSPYLSLNTGNKCFLKGTGGRG